MGKLKTIEEVQELLMNLLKILELTKQINLHHKAYKLPIRQVKDNVNIVMKRLNKMGINS